jgi:HEAT repeat protein
MRKELRGLFLIVCCLGCDAPKESTAPPRDEVGDTVRRVLAETKYPNQMGQTLQALEALGPAAVPALLESLDSGNALTRETAARALGRMKEPRAVEPTLRLFEERLIDDGAAYEVMGSMGSAATATLLHHLDRFKDDGEVAPRLLRMLSAGRDPGALPELQRLYPGRNEWVQARIAETARAISPETYTREFAPREYERIETAFEYDPVRFALEACRLAEHYEPGTALLRRALRHADPSVRGAPFDCDPPLGDRAEALLPELEALLATSSLEERFENVVQTRGIPEALKFVDAHFVRKPPRVGAGDYRYEPLEMDRGGAEPFWSREPSCPPAPYTLGASDNLRYDPEYEVVVKVRGRSVPVRGPGRWPASNDPEVAREVTVYGEGQSTIGTLNRVEWTCADPCGELAVLCSWEARYWTGHRGWSPQFVVPGRHRVQPVAVTPEDGPAEAWAAESIRWVRDGGTISVFAEGSRVSEFFGDYTGPDFEVFGRLGDAGIGPYVVRIVGKFWKTDAVIHRAGATWHSHEGAGHDMGGTCENTGEPGLMVPGLGSATPGLNWPLLGVVEKGGKAEVVWEPSPDASRPEDRFRGTVGEVGPLLMPTFGEGCHDVASKKAWPAPGSSCAFSLGEHKRYRFTSVGTEGRHSLVLEREAPIEARQSFLLLPPGVAPSEVELIFAGDLDGDGHLDLVVSTPICDCPSNDRHVELLVSSWGYGSRLGENPLLRSLATFVGSPAMEDVR